MSKTLKTAAIPLDVSAETKARFWKKVEIKEADECWVWTAYTNDKGYGRLTVNRSVLRAHRVSLAWATNHSLTGLVVMHTCDNPPCCNPAHLRIGTVEDNNRDCLDKGRKMAPAGEEHSGAKLTENDVKLIRASPVSQRKALSVEFNLRHSYIREIQIGRTWRHVK